MFKVEKLVCICFVLSSASVLAQEAIFGRVYQERTGRPIDEVDIMLPSGKKISQNKADGRFELAVPNMRGKLIFSRNGFALDTLDLNTVNDNYNIEIYLKDKTERLSTERLETETPLVSNAEMTQFLSPEKLELYTGMQLDLAEQARLVPGVSATQEFKDERSFLGGIPGSNSTLLGPVALKNTRHLNVGLPGNSSAISPLWVGQLIAHPGVSAQRPLTAAGGDLEMSLRPVKVDALQGNLRAGSVLREMQLEMPMIGDGVRVGFRLLDGSVMSNLGNKYFSEFRKRGEEDSCIDPCKSSEFGNKFDLTSYDFFAQSTITDSTGQLDIFWHQISDDYSIRLDTAHSYSVIGNQRIEIFSGIQEQMVGAFQYRANEGWQLFGSWQGSELQSIQRDSAALWSANNSSPIYREDRNLLQNEKVEYQNFDLGGSYPIFQSGPYIFDLGVQYRQGEKNVDIRMPAKLREFSQVQNEFAGVVTIQKGRDFEWSAGYKTEIETGIGQPTTTLRYAITSDHFRPYSAVAWNGDVVWEKTKSGKNEYESRFESNALGQIGIEFDSEKWNSNLFGFGRAYPEAGLPRPEVFTAYAMPNSSSSAWLAGAGFQLEYKPTFQHGFQWVVNTQYGEYQEPSGLPFPSNRLLDMIASWRWYPRNDSLLSMIVTHRTSVGEPTYQYGVDLQKESLVVDHHDEELATHRTDLRLQLNLSSAWPPLQSIQFYLELDNVFAAFDSEFLSYLGSDNARQRGYTSKTRGDFEEGFRQIEPYLAPGMGFFLQFGVEGRFGF